MAVDALALLEAADRGDWRRVFQLYRGCFLAGRPLSLPDSLEEWIGNINTRIVRATLRAYDLGVALATESGDWRTANELAVAVRDIHPSPHEVDRTRLFAAAALGEIRRAARLAVAIPGTLARPKTANGEALRAVADYLLAQREAAQATPYDNVPFIGRAAAFRILKSALQHSAAGSLRCVIVQGETGIGKTRLAEHFLRYAVLKGARVLLAKARQDWENVSYSVVADLLRSGSSASSALSLPKPLRAALGVVLPELVAGSSETVRFPTVEAVSGSAAVNEAVSLLLRSHARAGPLVVLVDDIELADEESLMLLQYCFQRLSDEPIVFICCLRSDVDRRPAVEHTTDLLMAAGRGRRLQLGELCKDEVWRLFDAYEEVSAMPVAEDVRLALYHVAGGQPFFLIELLRHRSAGQADGSHSNNPLPASLIAAIRGRLDCLPGPCHRLLQVLAALGQVVDEQVLTDIVSADDRNSGASLECLCRSGLVVRDSLGVRIAQKLVGDVVLGSLTETEKRRLHGCIASRIALRGSHSDALVASYFERAGEYDRAAQHFEGAAAAALAAEAFGAAEQFARYALDFGDREAKARAAATMMTVLIATRRYSEAERLLWRFGGAGMNASPIGLHLRMDEDTLRLLADLAEGPLEESRLLACAERLVDPSASTPLNFGHAELFRVIAGHAASWGEPGWWLGFVERFKARARRCEDDVVAALALSACACVEAVFVTVESAERTARIALDRSAASGRRFVEARARAAFGTVALLAGRLEVAAHELRRSHDVAQALGLFGAATAAGNNLAVALMELGRWRAAVDLLTTDLQCLTAHDSLVRRCNLSVAFSEIGNHRLAFHYAETVVGEAKHLGALWAHALGHAVLGGIAFDCGDDVSARARYSEVVQSLDCHSMAGTDSSYALVFAARWEGHDGRTDAAVERLDQAICSAASKHVLGAMRLQIARAVLLGRIDRAEASRSLLELAERAGAMDARSVVARAEAALRSLREASCTL